MSLQGRKVLVTGAGGFIGSHLVERLLDLGAEVTAFLRYNSRGDVGHLGELPPDARASVRIAWGDLRGAETVRRAVAGREIVFHLAALIGIPYSYVHPEEYVDVNIRGTANILSAARDAAVERVIHTSTSETYGTAQRVPIDEDHPLVGQSPYSASKIAADQMAVSYYRAFALPVTILRPFNTYGPRQSLRGVIPTIIAQTLAGKTVRLGSLHPTRDYTFVKDIVEAFVLVADCERAAGELFNVGSGQEIAIGELARRIARIIGTQIEIVQDPKRVRPEASEVGRLVASWAKIREAVGWEPATSLDEGLRATVEWVRGNIEPGRAEVYHV